MSLLQLPLELYYQIARYLPLTKDILAFSLTNSRICRALFTPALFKDRLEQRGWDVKAWEEEGDDTTTQSPDEFKRWMYIDHIYDRTIQLFDEASAGDYFLITSNTSIANHEDVLWTPPEPGQDNPAPNVNELTVYDGEKTVIWLKKLSGALPSFVTHRRAHITCFFSPGNTYFPTSFPRRRKPLANHRAQILGCYPCLFEDRRRPLHRRSGKRPRWYPRVSSAQDIFVAVWLVRTRVL
jgi:hypothetical protein